MLIEIVFEIVEIYCWFTRFVYFEFRHCSIATMQYCPMLIFYCLSFAHSFHSFHTKMTPIDVLSSSRSTLYSASQLYHIFHFQLIWKRFSTSNWVYLVHFQQIYQTRLQIRKFILKFYTPLTITQPQYWRFEYTRLAQRQRLQKYTFNFS